MRTKLKLVAAAVQYPIGSEDNFKGVVDLVRMKAYYNEGRKGHVVKAEEIPQHLLEIVMQKRRELIEQLAEVNDEIAELYLDEKEPTTSQLLNAIRTSTLALKFTPVFMGSAYHNCAVQPMLDGVIDYLPSPHQVDNYAYDISNQEQKVKLANNSNENLVSLAFKLEEGRFGQLTYLRVYQGTIKRGQFITNVRNDKKVKVSRLVRMHSNEMEDVDSVGAGEICALFGIDCASGDTFIDGNQKYAMTSMYIPKPVISLSIEPKGRENTNFSKALARFQREDPTFKVHLDPESKQTIISGMGELHLEIYVERMKREYNTECITGKPQVAFRETINKRIPFEYTHKKQSGGSGQFARIKGYIEPLDEPLEDGEELDFENATVGMNIPSQYIPAIEKGFKEACEKGVLIGHPITNVRFVLQDGLAHSVDSSELAFKLCTQYAFTEAFQKASPQILEPIMNVAVSSPSEYQSSVTSLVNKRKGIISDSEIRDEYLELTAEVPLKDMFGFSTDLRSCTQGKGEFSMEYMRHAPVLMSYQQQLVEEMKRKKEEKGKKK